MPEYAGPCWNPKNPTLSDTRQLPVGIQYQGFRQLPTHSHRIRWGEFDLGENSLWLYEIRAQRIELIMTQLDPSFRARWSPTGKRILFSKEKQLTTEKLKNHIYHRSLSKSNITGERIFYVYCIESNEFLSISLGFLILTALAWSNNDSSFYIATIR
ncbi:unnamed protein product [Rotaria magnacalcarata]